MNFYFDTLDNEMLGIAYNMVKRYNIKSIYTVSNEMINLINLDENYLKSIVKQIYIRQKLFLAEYDKYIYYDECPPVDESLLEYMHTYELEILKMMERSGYQSKSFEKRVSAYHEHLKYWNGLIDKADIQVAVFCYLPHAVHDYIIYCLCKMKGIPVVMANPTVIAGNLYHNFFYDYKDMQMSLNNTLHELSNEYKSKSIDEISLPEDFEKEFSNYTKPEIAKKTGQLPLKAKGEVLKAFKWHWKNNAQNAVAKTFYHLGRKIRKYYLFRIYDKLSTPADFSVPYIYFPLHYQPEMTTSPLGGVFVHQILAIKMLAFYLPPGAKIYVKEHPVLKIWDHSREVNLYYELKKINNVNIVPLNTVSNELIEHSVAVASITGTAGYEAMFKEKPFLMFGDNLMKYAIGTFNIRNNTDCKNAVEYVFSKGARHSLKDAKLFLKALSMSLIKTDYIYNSNMTDKEREENIKKLFDAYSVLLDSKIKKSE